jgi:hypothetical protein
MIEFVWLLIALLLAALPALAPERKQTRILQLPRLRPDQWEIASHPAKVKVVCMGRRWGKSVMCGAIALACAAAGGRVAWVVPTYKNGRPLWRWASRAVMGVTGIAVNKSERTIEFANGGFLAIYSADSPESILGEAFNLVIIDEAARVDEMVYYETILPTLADYDGDVILISTPKRRNWFYKEWSDAKDEVEKLGLKARRAAWTAPSNHNPSPAIQAAFHRMREILTDATFRQEWLAEFLADGGDVFRRVREAATAAHQDRAIATHRYVFGMDLGKYEDYTVIAVWDVTERSLVHIERIKELDYVIQLERLKELNQVFKPQNIIIEKNIGEMFIETARRDGLKVQAFQTTTQSKPKVIEDLVFGFEKGHAKIYNNRVLIDELEAYTMQRLPGGSLKYTAPAGLHDDCVVAACLGYSAIGRSPTWDDMVA